MTTTQSEAIEEILAQLKELNLKMDNLASAVRQAAKVKVGKSNRVPTDILMILSGMTAKQHITLQMLVAGCSNHEIAEKLGVTENTAKVHVRTVAAKLGVNSRVKVVGKMLEVFEVIDPDAYMELSGGIPVDWKDTLRNEDPDPCASLYR